MGIGCGAGGAAEEMEMEMQEVDRKSKKHQSNTTNHVSLRFSFDLFSASVFVMFFVVGVVSFAVTCI